MKTKKKNVKVVVQPSAELEALIDEAEAEAEGYEIYYKFCRSVRKHSRYITWRTHEKNVYVNKQGIRGKKYYYKVVTYKNISGGKMLRSAYSGVKGITAAPNTPILSFIIKYTIN